MTRIFKASALAVFAMTTAAPAFAAAHLDPSTMTCGEFNGLEMAEQDAIAVAVVADMNNDSDATIADNNGTATATDATEGTTQEESPTGTAATIAHSDGTATATTTVPAGDHMTRFSEEIDVLKRNCARNIDTMVTEAAAGGSGTR